MNLRANIVANYVGQLWSAVMGLAFLPHYVGYLGAEAYGLIGFYALLQGWLSVLEMGMGPLLNREMARYTGGALSASTIRDLLRSAEVLCWSVAIMIAVLIWQSAHWLSTAWLNVERLPITAVVEAVTLMGVVIAMRFCEGIYRSTLLGLQRQVWYNVVLVVSATLRWAGAAAVLGLISPTIGHFFAWQAFVSFLTVATLAYGANAALPSGPARFSAAVLRDVWRFAAGMLVISILSVPLLQLDKLIVSRLLPLSQFAFYSLAATLGNALALVAGPVAQAYYPQFTQAVAADDRPAVLRAYHQSSQLLAIVTIPPSLVLALFSAQVLTAWTADAALVRSTDLLLSAFALGAMFNGLMSMPYLLQLAHGWTRLAVGVNTATLMVLAPLLWLATSVYGALGAALVWLAVFATYGHVSLNLMHRRLLPEARRAWYVHAWLLPLAAGGLVGMAARVAMPLSTDRWTALAQAALAGALILTAVVAATPLGRKRWRQLLG